MDLSYITDRIIAMGFPSRGCESCYRNSAASTHDFMEQRHPGRFRIWNLCSEAGRSYSKDLFMGSVVEIGFLDHNAPRMEQVEEFCRGVDEWLAAHPDNVAAVHCKAGKVSCLAARPPRPCELPSLVWAIGKRGQPGPARRQGPRPRPRRLRACPNPASLSPPPTALCAARRAGLGL